MKICQLLHSMNTGGAEVLADRIGRGCSGQHEIVFACLDAVGEIGERLKADGFVVELLERGQGTDRGCMKRLADFISHNSIDLVHAHQYTPFFYAAAARSLWSSLPIIFTEHGRFYPDSSSLKRTVFNRLMLRKRDRVVAVGKNVCEALIKYESFPRKRIDVIYNGIDLVPFSGTLRPENRDSIRRDLGLSKDAILIVQVARLDPIKDHVTAIRALSELVAMGLDVHLAIVGDGPERQRIQNEIAVVGVGGRTHMLGLRRDIADLLRSADIALMTSVSEGIPLALIEAMACGLPCVSTDVGGIPEVVSHASGMLCPAKDRERIAKALHQLCVDQRLRNAMGLVGRRIALERFSEERMIAQYATLFASSNNAIGREQV